MTHGRKLVTHLRARAAWPLPPLHMRASFEAHKLLKDEGIQTAKLWREYVRCFARLQLAFFGVVGVWRVEQTAMTMLRLMLEKAPDRVVDALYLYDTLADYVERRKEGLDAIPSVEDDALYAKQWFHALLVDQWGRDPFTKDAVRH